MYGSAGKEEYWVGRQMADPYPDAGVYSGEADEYLPLVDDWLKANKRRRGKGKGKACLIIVGIVVLSVVGMCGLFIALCIISWLIGI